MRTAKPGVLAAVDVEAGVRPGENALGPLRAQQLLADKHRQDLAGEDLAQMVSPFPPLFVQPGFTLDQARSPVLVLRDGQH